MDASHWVVAFLLFTTLHGADQHPIIDDTPEFFDVFPGGQSTDEVPMNLSTADEIAASYKSTGTFSRPVYTSDIFQGSNRSLRSPGYKSTASTSEETEFLLRPSNITSQSEYTDKGTTFPLNAVIVMVAVMVIIFMFLYYLLYAKGCVADIHREQQIHQFYHPMQLIRGPVFA